MRRINLAVLMIAVSTVGLLTLSCNTATSTPATLPIATGLGPSASIPQTETSTDIGAVFPEDHVQIKYISFAPVVTRSEAIEIAKNFLQTGFNFDTKNLPAEATVGLFSGDVQQANTRSASDVEAWIVVVKQVPFVGSAGPFDPNHPDGAFQGTSQLNIAIDATTGEVLYGVITSTIQRFPATIPSQTSSSSPSLTFTPSVTPATSINNTQNVNDFLNDPSGSNFQKITPTYQESPEVISSQSNGDTVHANLVNFVGRAPSSDAQVTINNIPAIVTSDGSYYTFLDLAEGKNTIVIRTTQGNDTKTESITVTFTPPLTVSLDFPVIKPNIDYSKTPLTATGKVSEPRAQVIVNGNYVSVASDGYFSTEVYAGFIMAVAQFQNQIDTDWIGLSLENGSLVPAPGQYVMKGSTIWISNHEINLKAGDPAEVDFPLNIRKDALDTPGFDLAVGRVNDPIIPQPTPSPLPQGFKITLIPPVDSLYPNINYHTALNIETGFDLAPGPYYFQMDFSIGRLTTSQIFTVTVK